MTCQEKMTSITVSLLKAAFWAALTIIWSELNVKDETGLVQVPVALFMSEDDDDSQQRRSRTRLHFSLCSVWLQHFRVAWILTSFLWSRFHSKNTTKTTHSSSFLFHIEFLYIRDRKETNLAVKAKWSDAEVRRIGLLLLLLYKDKCKFCVLLW